MEVRAEQSSSFNRGIVLFLQGIIGLRAKNRTVSSVNGTSHLGIITRFLDCKVIFVITDDGQTP